MARKIVGLFEWKEVKVYTALDGGRLLYSLAHVNIKGKLKTCAYVGIMQGGSREDAQLVAELGTLCSFSEAMRRFPGLKAENYGP